MKKILIVDDYPDILEGLSYVLKDHYEVTTAGNLTEAKKEVSTTVFDVICSDYAMPDGTGLELNFADRKSLLCCLSLCLLCGKNVLLWKQNCMVRCLWKNGQRFDFVSSRKGRLKKVIYAISLLYDIKIKAVI